MDLYEASNELLGQRAPRDAFCFCTFKAIGICNLSGEKQRDGDIYLEWSPKAPEQLSHANWRIQGDNSMTSNMSTNNKVWKLYLDYSIKYVLFISPFCDSQSCLGCLTRGSEGLGSWISPPVSHVRIIIRAWVAPALCSRPHAGLQNRLAWLYRLKLDHWVPCERHTSV